MIKNIKQKMRYKEVLKFFKELPTTLTYYYLLLAGKTPKQLWEKELEELLTGLTENEAKIFKQCFVNMWNLEQSERGCGQLAQADTNKLLRKVFREAIPHIFIKDIVGVQPMTGPVGLIYKLIYKEEKQKEEPSMFEPSMFEPSVDNNEGGTRLRLEIVTDPVEACGKQLEAGWTPEAQQDMVTMGIEEELIKALGCEVAVEINNSILNNLKDIATTHDTFEMQPVGDGKQLLCEINKVAVDIGRKTRRGAANVLIVSPMMLAIIQSVAGTNYVQNPENKGGFYGNGTHTGILNGTIKVYCTLFDASDESVDYTELLIFGYKGSSDTDAGFFWGPYIPLMSCGILVHPVTFQPFMKILARESIHLSDNGEDYYSILPVKILSSFSD